MPNTSATKSDLLGPEEIWAAPTVNREVVREAYVQVAARMADVLEAKKSFEQKALSLFAGYVTLALAIFGFAAQTWMQGTSETAMFWALCGLGTFFCGGAAMFVLALWDANYGSLGSSPEMWLRNDVLCSKDDEMLPKVMAIVVRGHHERITASVDSNNRKARLIRAGLTMGLSAIAAFLVFLVVLALSAR